MAFDADKLLGNKRFKPGELIWAKMRGHPHWPARVSTRYSGIKSDEIEGQFPTLKLTLIYMYV